MSDHEDILMGLDAVTDRLNDADQLVRATRATYLNIAQINFSLGQRIVNLELGYNTTAAALNESMRRAGKAKELAAYMRDNPDHFTSTDVRDYAGKILDVLDGV